MKATDMSGRAPGGVRVPLAEKVPLATPFVVELFPIYACNFRCQYCYQAVEQDRRGYVSDRRIMPLELFKKCIDDMTGFPEPVKIARIAGLGEPLMHRDLVKMVEYAVQKRVARSVELITNGSLLTKEIADGLIDAGLSRMTVSLQGASAEAYRRVAHAEIDFERFADGLRYFHEHKKDTFVYLKVVDCALDGAEDRQRFYATFGDIGDGIAIETAVPIMNGIEYATVLRPAQERKTQYGLKIVEHEICPIPFYYMWVNPDGKVIPCNNITYPAIVGDVTTTNLVDIWKGRGYRQFLCAMLDGLGNASEVCRTCEFVRYRSFAEDGLKGAVDRLKAHYQGEVSQ